MAVKKGLIYRQGETVGEARISFMILILKWVAKILSWTGSALIIVSILGLVFVYIPLGMAEVKYTFSKTQLAKLIRETEKRAWEQKQKEEQSLQANLSAGWAVPDMNYSIYISKIFAVSKVIPDVNAADPKIYLPALKQGVAEAANLSHPGEKGTTYLFAHSVGTRWDFARYNAVFYLLDKLALGDRIEIVYKGRLFRYEMVEREVLEASDTKYLVPQELAEKLVLSTCYPPGTTWKRLVVIARRI
jgi:LPXTG-site transpeptidase (sortase) family protein